MSVYYVGSMAYDSDYLAHHGIKGQKWGIRRYQNADGTLTEDGKKRYLNSNGELNAKGIRKMQKYGSRLAKGQKLMDKNKTIGKEIAKGVVRQSLLIGASAVGKGILTAGLVVSMPEAAILGGAAAIGASVLATPLNVINTVNRSRAINTAENAGYLGKNTRKALEQTNYPYKTKR